MNERNMRDGPPGAVERPVMREREAGLSLIEIMIGVVLVVVFLGAVLTLIAQQGAHRLSNVQTSLATSAALTNLEAVRAMDFADVPKLDGTGFAIPGINGETGPLTPVAGDPDGLCGEFDVRTAVSSGGVTIHFVSAIVRWQHAGREREVKLESLVGERK